MAEAVKAFTVQIVSGEKYISTVYRGTEYTLKLGRFGHEVSTRRIGYGGQFHQGGFKRYDTLAELVAGCKAFGDVTRVISLHYGVVV